MLLDANTSLQLPSQAWRPKLASLSALRPSPHPHPYSTLDPTVRRVSAQFLVFVLMCLARWGSVRVDVTACVYWILSTERIHLTSKGSVWTELLLTGFMYFCLWKSMVEFEFWGQGWCLVLLWQPDWLFQSCRKIKSSVWKSTSQAPAWWKCFLKNKAIIPVR